MKKFFLAVPVAIALAVIPMASQAKGCLKGAVVGGVAGHFVKNHGVIGAAAGCAIGTHEANKKEREAQAAAANNQVATTQVQPAPKKHFWSKT
jgi:hypothetical protein